MYSFGTWWVPTASVTAASYNYMLWVRPEDPEGGTHGVITLPGQGSQTDNVGAMLVARRFGTRLLACGEDSLGAPTFPLWKSDNNGASWQNVSIVAPPLPQTFKFKCMCEDGEYIYIGGEKILYRSDDNGDTWSDNFGTARTYFRMAANPTALISIQASSGNTIWRSVDHAATFASKNLAVAGVTYLNLHDLTYGNGVFIAPWSENNNGAWQMGVTYSLDNGVTWLKASLTAPAAVSSGVTNMFTSYNATRGRFVLAATLGADAYIFESSDGVSWSQATFSGVPTSIRALGVRGISNAG